MKETTAKFLIKEDTPQLDEDKIVFLGGTIKSKWRDILIPKLTMNDINPKKENWKPSDALTEIEDRAKSDIVLYVLTPRQTGPLVYAEIIDSAHQRPHHTYCYIIDDDEGETWTEDQSNSLGIFIRLAKDADIMAIHRLSDMSDDNMTYIANDLNNH